MNPCRSVLTSVAGLTNLKQGRPAVQAALARSRPSLLEHQARRFCAGARDDDPPPFVSVRRPKIYRKYSDGFLVREMTAQDATYVQTWFRLNMGVTSVFDLPLVLDIYNAPGALYIGEYKGRPVSSCVRIPWAENKLYGSFLYVVPEYRKYGFAARMRDEVAQNYVGDKILVVDGVSEVTPGYIKEKGYIKQFTTARYTGKSTSVKATPAPNLRIVKAQDVPLQQIVYYDNKHFCSQNFPTRREYLKQWRANQYGSFAVAKDSADKVVGFGLRKLAFNTERGEEHGIGPLYADSPDIGEVVFEALCKDVPEAHITIDI